MVINRAYKVKLYPTQEQLSQCYRFAGYARFAYNWALGYAIDQKEETEKIPHWMEIKKQWNAIKYNEFEWSQELLQRPAEEAIRNLGVAFTNFFRDLKKDGGKKARFPTFKSRYTPKRFRLYGVKVEYNRIKLPGIGWVKFRQPGYIPTEGVKYLGVSISECGGSWWASVQVEQEIESRIATGSPVGVDLGVSKLATTSNGYSYKNPRALGKYLKQLKRVQRKLSRQQKGSQNYRKTKQKLAKLHFKISNIRQHATNKASAGITARHSFVSEDRPSVIVLEDLNVAGMVKNRRLARVILDANMGEMKRQIEYKSEWSGTEIQYADRFYPSSKRCSGCGVINGTLTLSDRVFECSNCGCVLDRDYNAALNLVQLAK